jgi:hypothetical protein
VTKRRRQGHEVSPWLLALGAIAGALLAYVGARGGPDHAWKELKEAFGFVDPPRIVSVQQKSRNTDAFVVSIQNPSLEQIQITSFYAESAMQFVSFRNSPGAGPLPVIKAEQGRGPAECGRSVWFPLITPLVIEPESSGGLEIRPWRRPCDFYLRVVGTSGASRTVAWTPQEDVFLAKLKRTDPKLYRALLQRRELDRDKQ